MLLNRKFNVTRGLYGPHTSAHKAAYDIKKSGGSYEEIPAGSIVTFEEQDGVVVITKATTPDLSNSSAIPVGIVEDDSRDFNTSEAGKLTVIQGRIEVETDQFISGAFNVGDSLTFSEGKLKLKASDNDQIIGHVISYDAANGILRAMLDL